MAKSDYQLIILGGGPAGLTAGLYAARDRLQVLLLEKGVVGGQVLVTDWIDNYPGFPDGITGSDLIEKMAAQASRFGLETKNGNVVRVELADNVVAELPSCRFEAQANRTWDVLSDGKRFVLGVPDDVESDFPITLVLNWESVP